MNGSEYGKLVKMNDNAIRLRKQVYISDNKKQTLKFAKKIILLWFDKIIMMNFLLLIL